MAIIADKSYSLTWGDYLWMDRETYSLKERVIAIRDHGLEKKADCASSALSSLLGDIQWLTLNVKQNATLSKDQPTSKLLKDLYNRIDQFYRNACHQEWRVSEGLTSYGDAGNYDISSLSTAVTVACSDDLWWSGVHVPVDVGVHLPDPSSVFNPEPSGGVN